MSDEVSAYYSGLSLMINVARYAEKKINDIRRHACHVYYAINVPTLILLCSLSLSLSLLGPAAASEAVG